ncbi:Crp/Fnr family transcriptional regulator [Streptococcus massiliensis]|uniref:Catabolite gene activator and regulatory subunit of cAMP-dependent protein kinase n=1 Tax=Streptococcus massiliensis TaxID=313439 RepID=A0A380KYW8_9STRE|nr:Crp/Fnr family transcriptional regulator [Streptococcus massiliensis]SUN76825.1 catabolite gene activator and regulatory subunit of cAMP-dependent protein kinase [Streptococcus massiliensis]
MIQKAHYQFIRQHPAFINLRTEHFDRLASDIKFRKSPKGQIIFFEGDPRDRLFLLYKGYARIEQYDQTASYSYLDYAKENSLFPYGGMFEDAAYHYTAVAVTDVEYFTIPVEAFEHFAKLEPKQLIHIVTELSKILAFHELRLRNATLAGARDRVIQALSILCLDFCKEKDYVPFAVSMIELSRLAATTRETVHQVIKKLKEEEKIRYERKMITFLDKTFFLETYQNGQ